MIKYIEKKCKVCEKPFKTKTKKSTTKRIPNGFRPFGSLTCSRKCSRELIKINNRIRTQRVAYEKRKLRRLEQ